MFRSLLFLYAVEQPRQVSTFLVQFLSFFFLSYQLTPRALAKKVAISIFSLVLPQVLVGQPQPPFQPPPTLCGTDLGWIDLSCTGLYVPFPSAQPFVFQ